MRFIEADWPAPEQVAALTTCRDGGVSQDGFSSFNLANHVDDQAAAVISNRAVLRRELSLPEDPVWLNQVHGCDIYQLDGVATSVPQADAVIARATNRVCAVLTADCLPVLLCNKNGTAIAAIHAGWRGLLGGIIEKTVAQLAPADTLLAWLGPAIGPGEFEVGAEVRDAFMARDSISQQAFRRVDESHYLADLYALARMRLLQNGVKRIYGGEHCTYNAADQFYSYRREPITGRMASLIWLQA